MLARKMSQKTRGFNKNLQDHNTKHHCSRAKFAFDSTAVFPIVASTLVAVILIVGSPSVVLVIVLVLVLIRIAIALALRFTLGDIRSDANPSRKPQDGIQNINTCEGVDVAESSGSGPYGDGREIDQTGNTEPTLSRPSIALILDSHESKWGGGKKTHQGPIPGSPPIDTITFGPNRNGKSPCQKDEDGLYEVNNILHPPGIDGRS